MELVLHRWQEETQQRSKVVGEGERQEEREVEEKREEGRKESQSWHYGERRDNDGDTIRWGHMLLKGWVTEIGG